jgi:hypothetical protein
MKFYGLLAYIKLVGYVLVRVAVQDELNNFYLRLGEVVYLPLAAYGLSRLRGAVEHLAHELSFHPQLPAVDGGD